MSTTIYQIHEYSGEYEDYRDIIMGSYFKKSDAEAQMEILEQQEKDNEIQDEKCRNCPCYKLNFDKEGIKKIRQYCNNFKMSNEKELKDRYCVNKFCMWVFGTPTYEIVEVEVN